MIRNERGWRRNGVKVIFIYRKKCRFLVGMFEFLFEKIIHDKRNIEFMRKKRNIQVFKLNYVALYQNIPCVVGVFFYF